MARAEARQGPVAGAIGLQVAGARPNSRPLAGFAHRHHRMPRVDASFSVALDPTCVRRPDMMCIPARRSHWSPVVRTNIVIDDKLMQATLKATGIKTKREAVEQGLRTLLRLKQQTELRKLRGKYEWEGDLDAMRRDK